MTTAADVIARARMDLGYVEGGGADGRSGNLTKFWIERDPSLQGGSWCAVFVSDCFADAGAPLPRMDRGYGFMNCASARDYARAHGILDQDGHYAPGDILLMGPGGSQHTGIVISDDGTTIHTIEGNTSPDDRGSQTNGGGVYERRRPHGPFIYGAVKTAGILAAGRAPAVPSRPVSRPPVVPVKPKPIPASPTGGLHVNVIDLSHASNTRLNRSSGVKPLQRLLGIPADGLGGGGTRAALYAYQASHGLKPDAVFGRITAESMLAGR